MTSVGREISAKRVRDVQRTVFLPPDLDQRIQQTCMAEGTTFYVVTERLLRQGLVVESRTGR